MLQVACDMLFFQKSSQLFLMIVSTILQGTGCGKLYNRWLD